ncbi:unnamed protein product [Jaminaea pallidilutea]
MNAPSGPPLQNRRQRGSRLSLSGILWKQKEREAAAGLDSSAVDLSTPPSSSHLPPSAAASASSRAKASFSAFLSPRFGQAESQVDPLITADYMDEEAVKAFAEALEEDQGTKELPHPHHSLGAAAWTKLGLPSLRSPPIQDPKDPHAQPTQTIPVPPSSAAVKGKVGKIAAVSDFAPIRERTQSADTGRREGVVYALLRWPLLLFIFLTIGLEFFAYVVTRQIVNVVEWSVAHRGRKGVLRRQMRKAQNFDQWRSTAVELDMYMDHEKWKRQDSSGLYDWILVKKVMHSLRTFREQSEDTELMAVLDLCCRNNFAGTESFRLYSETYYGTKYLVEEYLAEVERGIHHVVESEKITAEQKRTFFRGISKNLGRSGLCLSGGGAFGYYHVGLVKALLDADLLPKIVSGTSAGGLIAALTCTRTDKELSRLLVPELADRITACEEPIRIWAKRAWQTGARFDPIQWADKASFFTMGSLTFREAFERTGKTLNISVIPSDRNSPVKLLNYLTAPRCVIWSALLASAAVPGLLPPVCLMQKTRKGEYIPWNWGHRFKDGSLRVDIPLQDLHSMFHVNYPIVSQVNPHVHLFFFAPTGNPGRPVAHRKGKGWRGGFLLSASEHVLKLHLSVNFKIIRDLDLLPAILGTDWSGVFLQRFGGAVTIWPKTRFWDWIRILSDPDRSELSRMIDVAQQATWPKLHMIENRIRLERAVEVGRKSCRQRLRQEQQKQHHELLAQQVEQGLRSALPTPMEGGPHQDSGTDASVGRRRQFAGLSDTDGELGSTSEYFKRPVTKRNRLFGGLSGMMTPGDAAGDDDTAPNTPADGTLTPGELPLPSRSRSTGMEDQEIGKGLDDDEDDRNSFDASREVEGASGVSRPSIDSTMDFASLGDGDAAISTVTPRANGAKQRTAPHKALTAAALTPSVHRSRRRSAQQHRSSNGNGSGHGNMNGEGNAGPSSDLNGSSGSKPPPASHRHHQFHRHSRHNSNNKDWSGGRGSIGPSSPWDEDGAEDDGASSSSDLSSSASDVGKGVRQR